MTRNDFPKLTDEQYELVKMCVSKYAFKEGVNPEHATVKLAKISIRECAHKALEAVRGCSDIRYINGIWKVAVPFDTPFDEEIKRSMEADNLLMWKNATGNLYATIMNPY